MSATPTPPPSRRPSPEALDRLYALWLMSTLLLLLLVVILALVGSGQLRQHATRISEQSRAIEQLRTELSRIRQELSYLEPSVPPVIPALPSPLEQPPAPTAPSPQRPSQLSAARPTTSQPDSNGIQALLRRALRRGEELPYEIADETAAERALQQTLRLPQDAAWSGETWAQLAALARLLSHDTPAETFSLRATAAGEFPHAYYEIATRQLLAQQKTTEALVFAKRLVAGRPRDPTAVLLLAETYGVHGDLAAADVALDSLGGSARLPVSAKLRLAGLLVALERWDRLEALLGSVGEVPAAAVPELNFLRAVLAIQRGRPPEGLAILDNLLADYPDDYNLQTWRGIALLEARQFQSAREALAHAEQRPDRPEAWYWRGMLELRTGNADEAVVCLHKALAASYRFAPASEALATIALNQGDLPTALQNLTNAIAANSRRASAHFLLAIVHAKMSRPDETADALRAAFQLNPGLLQAARQTKAITSLLPADVLTTLAADAGAAPPEPNKPEP